MDISERCVAAAGNDGKDIFQQTNRVFFASRSIGFMDTIVVLNGGPGGRLGNSSCMSATRLEAAYTVTFDGRVGQSSGTSFAAPRVAWLLALRAALLDPAAAEDWRVSLATWIKSLRRPNGSVMERTRIDAGQALRTIGTP